MSNPLDIIIVERLGSLKQLSVKEFKLEDLYKKCGFKKAEDFVKQVEWNVKCDGNKYIIQVFAKTEGRANSENKYDFPPPIDTKLFYGSCAILCKLKKEDGTSSYVNINILLWNKIYEKLFGGFEDLDATAKADEEEEDELEKIPKEMKTKQGYLKDGFVIDSSDTEDNNLSELDDYDDDEYSTSQEKEDNVIDCDDDFELDDVGSELSEESYDYDDNNVEK